MDRPSFMRHAQACPGHPRLARYMTENVDGRDKPGHDGYCLSTS
jgi:hypothetical protein